MIRATRCPGRGLYLLTPDEPDDGRLLARLETVLDAGCTLLQYRNKVVARDQQARQARAVLALCRRYQVPLVINDDCELAADIGADGVHLGREDGGLSAARRMLGTQAIIGASCYHSLALAQAAVAAGATYVAFGAFFPSPTKPTAVRADIAVLNATADWPVATVAIGGIRPDNAGRLINAGADLIAVVSGVFDAADPAAAVRAYLSCFPESEPA